MLTLKCTKYNIIILQINDLRKLKVSDKRNILYYTGKFLESGSKRSEGRRTYKCFKEHFEQGADAKNNLDARVKMKMGTKYLLRMQRINIIMFKYQNQIIFTVGVIGI